MRSAPRIVDIPPQDVSGFIEAIASAAYELSRGQGGALPYTVIREITENFIHAGFLECTISILDGGNTIRFADQGPGIRKKDLVLQPGVSSATQKMKDYIRGVGSGFPLVRDYLSSSHGFLGIEDNAEEGTIVTISLNTASSLLNPSSAEFITQANQAVFKTAATEETRVETPGFETQGSKQNTLEEEPVSSSPQTEASVSQKLHLASREERTLLLLNEHGLLGTKDLALELNTSPSTATRIFQKLETLGMVEEAQFRKRILSNAGMAYVQELLVSENMH